ncbi:MAG: Ig-like domain-containing protein, partial [Chromatiales bacterium]
NFALGSTVAFSATATDAEDGDLTGNISWSVDGVVQTTTGGSFTTSSLSVGEHTIIAAVTDSDGEPGSDSITVMITVANTEPTVTIISPRNNQTFRVGELITFTGTATDAEDGDLSSSIIWTSSKDGYLDTGAAISSTLTVGNHTIIATVTDASGATTSTQILIRLRNK